MSTRKLIVSLIGAGILLTACADDKGKKTISTPAITFEKEGEALLLKPGGDTITRLDIEIADTDYERETGLMYRDHMEENHAMLFIFENEAPRGFYMKNTEISLDILFLDKARKVVKIAPNTRPKSLQTIPSEVPAQYVLEINAGLAEEWNIKQGDSLVFKQTDNSID